MIKASRGGPLLSSTISFQRVFRGSEGTDPTMWDRPEKRYMPRSEGRNWPFQGPDRAKMGLRKFLHRGENPCHGEVAGTAFPQVAGSPGGLILTGSRRFGLAMRVGQKVGNNRVTLLSVLDNDFAKFDNNVVTKGLMMAS